MESYFDRKRVQNLKAINQLKGMKVESTIITIQNLGTILAKVVIFLYTPLQRNTTPAVGGQRIIGKYAGAMFFKSN